MAESKGINFSDLYKLASGVIDAASLELHQLSDAFPVERKYILDTAFRYGGFLSSKPYHYII